MRNEVTTEKDNFSKAYPHLVFDNFNNNIGDKIKQIF